MQTNALKSQKTSGSLGDLHANDGKKGRRIGMGTLYLIFRHFQRLGQGFVGLKK